MSRQRNHGVFRSRYIMAGSFSDASDAGKYWDGRIFGVMTECQIITGHPEEQDQVNMKFRSSRTTVLHSALWRESGINPKDPVASEVTFEGGTYQVGGSFSWDPALGGLRLYICERSMERPRDLPRDERLTATLVVASASLALDHMDLGPLTPTEYGISLTAGEVAHYSGMQPFTALAAQLQPYLET